MTGTQAKSSDPTRDVAYAIINILDEHNPETQNNIIAQVREIVSANRREQIKSLEEKAAYLRNSLELI